jgi:hypothetical protein
MATSPNYGFQEPDNTSLVKDGALAMRTLGNDIDAFLNRPLASNVVVNSAFQVWQRGTSFSYSGGQQYMADRWCFGSGTVGRTISRQVTGDTTNLPNIQYCARVQRDSGNTSVSVLKWFQSFETINSIPLVGKTVTFSYYARRGANYSSSGNTLGAYVFSGTGIDQNLDIAYTGAAIPVNASGTLTTTWQRFTATAAIASNATEIAIRFEYSPTGTAGAADYFEVTGVQLEVGNQASPFQTASGGSIQGETAMCQRYYQRRYSETGFTPIFSAFSYNSTLVLGVWNSVVPFRIPPTAIDWANTFYEESGGASYSASSMAINQAGSQCSSVQLGTSGLVQHRTGLVRGNGTANAGFVGLSAEL